MSDLQQVLEQMKIMEANIVTKIEGTLDAKIAAITDKVLQKAHDNISNNTLAIAEIKEQLSPIKEDISSNSETVQEVISNINDVTERISKCERNDALNDMRLKSIEEEIGDKTYEMNYADKRRIRNIEFQIAALQAKVLVNNTKPNAEAMMVNDDNVTNTESKDNDANDDIVTTAVKDNNDATDDNVFRTPTMNNRISSPGNTHNKEDIKMIVDKAKTKIGLSPVTVAHVRHFVSEESKHLVEIEQFNTPELKKTRIDAGIDFLYKELGFSKTDIKIKDAKLAPSSNATILWIEATEQEIKRIYFKSARVQNNDINLVTYFPSILWQRKISLIENCKKQQKIQPKLRYQVRLGYNDISLFTKEVGEKFYICTPIQAYGELAPIMDDNIPKQGPSNPNKRMRSASPPISTKRQCNDADSSLDDDTLNQVMDSLDAASNVDSVINVSQSINTRNANI